MRASCRSVVAACVPWVLPAGVAFSAPTYYSSRAAFVAATSPVVVEDFESAPAAQILGSLTRSVGTFMPYAGAPGPNIYIAAANYTNFGLPGPVGSQVLTANGDEDFELFFAVPTDNVGFDTYLNQFGPATIRLYSAGNVLVDTFIYSHDSTKVGFFGVVSDVAMTSIRWTTTIGRTINTGYDNILIGTACPGI